MRRRCSGSDRRLGETVGLGPNSDLVVIMQRSIPSTTSSGNDFLARGSLAPMIDVMTVEGMVVFLIDVVHVCVTA